MKTMVKKYKTAKGERIEQKVGYIPFRYILAGGITVLEVLTMIGAVVALCYLIPVAYLAALAMQIFCVVRIVASDDNPDYKIPWLLTVLILPVAGFMLYFIFYSRRLKRKFVKRMAQIWENAYKREDAAEFAALERENSVIAADARMLCRISGSHLFCGTQVAYFSCGEDLYERMLQDLREAKHFIFMEYFIIEHGIFWDTVLSVLEKKAANGVEVRVMYDDIGCMTTLPGNYARQLRAKGILATPFSRLRGDADSEFNNRNHRKITVIDGRVGYTGGINLADEYINATERFGHWKDVGVRLEGEAVHELTALALSDYAMNVKRFTPPGAAYYPTVPPSGEGFVVPFGDGPRPIYQHFVGKAVIQNMLAGATRYAWITTPYLIPDNDLCVSLENAALRGVDVRIVLPHVPDKRVVFAMSRSYYRRLMEAGVRIYEYTPGFIHGKSYLADDTCGMIGSINMDYRSLVHHFENGVWMYRCPCLQDLKADMMRTMEQSTQMDEKSARGTFLSRVFCAVLRVFAPLL